MSFYEEQLAKQGLTRKAKRRKGNFYYDRELAREAGSLGGKAKGKPKGFAALKARGELDKIKAAGAKGGKLSKRRKSR